MRLWRHLPSTWLWSWLILLSFIGFSTSFYIYIILATYNDMEFIFMGVPASLPRAVP